MKLVNSILKMTEGAEDIYKKESEVFKDKLSEFGYEDVDVKIRKDGSDYLVELSDGEESENLIFGIDDEKDAYCLLADTSDLLGEESDCVDLQTVTPALDKNGVLDFTDLSWMNQSVLDTIFGESKDEKIKTVIRGGKKQKVVVKTKKKRLTPKQKAALAKLHRKPKTAAQKKAQKKSMMLRKRMGL